MNKIRELPPEVAMLLAAGEVVERPALAIKEMVENSFDAGATAVSIETTDGGLSLMRVTDNGIGIAKEDLKLAFIRNATSKIAIANDIDSVATMGFRGEALASIAAVSKVTLTTRRRGDDSGFAISMAGGQFLGIREAASPDGTSVAVSELFYNVPARRKFMKSAQTEAAYVAEWIGWLMFARPDISIRYKSFGKQIMRSSGDSDTLSVIASVWGHAQAKAMVAVDGATRGVAIGGYIGVGDAASSTRAKQVFVLNGRVVKCKGVSKAVEYATRGRVFIGKYPTFVLSATVDYSLVDINVHPNKLEVRFRDENAITAAIASLVEQAFTRRDAAKLDYAQPVPSVSEISTAIAKNIDESIPTINVKPIEQVADDGRDDTREAYIPPMMPVATPINKHVYGSVCEPVYEPVALFEPEVKHRATVIGSAFNQYIMTEYNGALYVIDQHAAHERYLFDRFNAGIAGGMSSQPMLEPLTIELGAADMALLDECGGTLREMGFVFERFGDNAVRVTETPNILGRPAADLARAAIESLREFAETPVEKRRREELIRLSCKKAIKGGETLTREQIENLLASCDGANAAPTCPHGRPICVMISKNELDKRFRRV